MAQFPRGAGRNIGDLAIPRFASILNPLGAFERYFSDALGTSDGTKCTCVIDIRENVQVSDRIHFESTNTTYMTWRIDVNQCHCGLIVAGALSTFSHNDIHRHGGTHKSLTVKIYTIVNVPVVLEFESLCSSVSIFEC